MCKKALILVFQTAIFLATVRNGATQEYILVANGADSDETRFQVSISNCTNLSLEFTGSISWTNTRGHCARFWSDYNCTGDSIEILPRSPSHHDLRPWKFNSKAHSVGPCRDPCDAGVTGHQPDVPFPVLISKETDSLFLKPAHRPDILKLNVGGCTPVPSHFQKQTAAVETNGHCLQLWSNENCGIFSSDDDTVELSSGTPLHGNIKYGWWIQTVKAVSHCRHKCNDTREVTTEYYEPTTVTSSSMPLTTLNSINGHNSSHSHFETTPSSTAIGPTTMSPPTSIRPSTTGIPSRTPTQPPTTTILNESYHKQMKSVSEDSGSGWIFIVSGLALALVALGYLAYYRKFQFLKRRSVSGMRMRLYDNFEC